MTTNVVAFFCEDVRQEPEGKFTLIGIYPDNISFEGSVPEGQAIALSKMCVFTRISFDPHEAPTITSAMLNPDGSKTDLGGVDPKAISDAKNSAINQNNPIAGINLIMQLMPFPIQTFGRYQFEVTVGKEAVIAGALNAVQAIKT